MRDLFVDIETASPLDIAEVGAEYYARHGSTRVLCVGWAIDDDAPRAMEPLQARQYLDDAIRQADRIWMHNANFDAAVWRAILSPRHGFPTLPSEKVWDSAAACRRAGLPAGLDAAARALGLQVQKDADGAALMKSLCRPKPREDGIGVCWGHITPEAIARLARYCEQDVAVLRAIVRALPAWAIDITALERWAEVWTARANERGVCVDATLLAAMIDAHARLEDSLPAALRSPQKVKACLASLGVVVDDVTEDTIERLLAHEDARVRDVAQARLLVARASVRKLSAIARRADEDDRGDTRVANILRYYGAHTGRWAGEGIQLQNLPRDSTANDDEVRAEAAKLASENMAEVAASLSKLLRPLIVARAGHVLVRADFSQIEARVLLYLACARIPSAARLLHEFLQRDAYRDFAARIFQKPAEQVTKAERQLGKAAVLGLGYGMGAERFVSTVRTMCGQELSLTEAQRIVRLYRETFHPVTELWQACSAGAQYAFRRPGVCASLHMRLPRDAQVFFVVDGDWLLLGLPSGRFVAYHKAAQREDGGRREIVANIGHRGCVRLYGGMLVENMVQAVARDVLVEAMRNIEQWGWHVQFSVHDEIIVEAPRERVEQCIADVTRCMSTAPPWLHEPTLPWAGAIQLFGTEVAFGRHYGK